MEIKEKIRITETDFFMAIFAIFTLRDYKIVLFNEAFEESMAKVFREFMEYVKQKRAELRFRIRLHQFHGDSEVIHKNISFLAGGWE